MTTSAQELQELRREVEQNTRWNMSLLLTLVTCLVLVILYEYRQFRQLTQPDTIVAIVEERIKENYPEVRAALKKQVVEAAPVLLEKLSRKAVRSVPELRQDLVAYLGRQLAVGLDEATAFSAVEFRETLRENRDLVEQAAEELKEFPDRAEKFIVGLEKRLEKRWDVDFQKQARFVLRTLHGLNAKLERLSKNERLTPEDLLARRIVRIVRAMQEQEFGG